MPTEKIRFNVYQAYRGYIVDSVTVHIATRVFLLVECCTEQVQRIFLR